MTLDMTRGRPLPLLLRFAIPMMFSALLQQMYTICDSFIIGRLLGTDAFTAASSAVNVNWFPLHITMGATTGCGVALAQCFGLDDGGISGLFAGGGPSVRFLTRYDGEV